MSSKKNLFNILIGILLFVIIAWFPIGNAVAFSARIALATMVIMVYWWITRPVHIAITALLPILINAFFGMAPMPSVLDDYANPIVILLFGANLLIVAWTFTGLDKRIALRSLLVIGTSVRGQLIVWFLLSAITSAILPNAVVVAALCPIALAMMRFSSTKDQDLTQSKAGFNILMTIAWGAGLGGFGTPLGGAMNLVAIKHIESLTGTEYMYITWVLKMLPFFVVLCISTLLYLLLIPIDIKHFPGSHAFFLEEYKKMGKADKSQKLSLILFILAVVLSFARPLYQTYLPELKPSYIFLLAGVLTFFLRGNEKKPLLNWKMAVGNLNWGLMLLFSGGLAVGNLLIQTGATEAISSAVVSLDISGTFILVMVFVALGMFLSNSSSNTAASAILIPIVIGIVASKGNQTLSYIYIAAAACNCAFLLPTSVRAIPVGYGLDVGFMFKKGILAVIISFVVLTLAGYVYLLV